MMASKDLRDQVHALVDSVQSEDLLRWVHELLSRTASEGSTGVWHELTEEQRDRVLKAHASASTDKELRPSDEVLRRNRP